LLLLLGRLRLWSRASRVRTDPANLKSSASKKWKHVVDRITEAANQWQDGSLATLIIGWPWGSKGSRMERFSFSFSDGLMEKDCM